MGLTTSIGQDVQEDEMELYDEGFETEGYQTGRRGTTHPKLRIRTSLFSAIEVSRKKLTFLLNNNCYA